VLALQRDADHRRVPRHDAGVVGHEQRAPVGRYVRDPLGMHPPPAVVQELEQWQRGVGELLVEAPVVLLVVAAEPAHDGLEAVAGLARQRQRGAGHRPRRPRPALEPAPHGAQEGHDRAQRIARAAHAAALSATPRAAA
jgi:hypothetical protein